MGIGETDSHPSQAFHVRRMDLDIIVISGEVLVGAGVAHPHVVRHQEDDIRF